MPCRQAAPSPYPAASLMSLRSSTSKVWASSWPRLRTWPAAPITALGVSAGGQTALKVTGDIANLVPVTTGIRDSGWIEILSGLAPGDQIVAKAGAFVRDGDRITPVAAQE